MINPLHTVDRVAATQRTLDRFRDKPFRLGSCDCVRIAAWHLRQFGYRPQLFKGGAYSSARGAGAALKRAGFQSLSDALAGIGLEPMAPAEAWVGDIIQGESGHPLDALGIYLGGGAMLGFHEYAAGAAVLRGKALGRAWRVLDLNAAALAL